LVLCLIDTRQGHQAGGRLSARISRNRLDRELALRGWTAQDLVRASGISAATISAARQGRPVRPSSIHRMVSALLKAPVLEGVAELIESDDGA
jgi:transcriptional regulator with XRE-family HTH domain